MMFVAENVKGILSANNKTAIKQIVEDFSNTGKYSYKTNVHLVNFANYGAPQLRERVLIIGVRNDIKSTFNIPSPSHNVNNYISAKEALKGVEQVKHNNEHQKILPGDKRDFERPLEPNKEERAFHQDLDHERWMPQASLGSKKRYPRDQREGCTKQIRNT